MSLCHHSSVECLVNFVSKKKKKKKWKRREKKKVGKKREKKKEKKRKERKKERKETRMSASVLKQDPNTQNVKKNAYLICIL